MEADFSGYATKAGLKCSDGRTIMPDAFKHQDKMQVPLVWQHGHKDPENVLGHVLLENRDDGVFAYGYFNKSKKAEHAHELLEHKDIGQMSIWANQLIERSKAVLHGVIREVSLVLSGANPGALIENVTIRHSDDDDEVLDDEAIIFTGLPLQLQHSDEEANGDDNNDDDKDVGDVEDTTVKDVIESMSDEQQEVLHYMIGEALQHGNGDNQSSNGNSDDETVQDVYNGMSDKQKQVLHFMIGEALASAGSSMGQSDIDDNESQENDDQGNKKGKEEVATELKHNVFEDDEDSKDKGSVLSHDDMKGIIADATRGGSLKDAVTSYAISHGIDDIDTLFPDAVAIDKTPEYLQRRVEWVATFLGAVRKSPFSRIKTLNADITVEEARAKGYIKGNLKKEEFFSVSRRITTPTTVYKKQSLDRDDVVDITDFDVIVWLKAEMRLMLDEELARAALIGDGRDISSDDKVNEQNIRPIAKEHELFATTIRVNIDDASSSIQEVVDSVITNRKYYKGTGMPNFYTTETIIAKFLLLRDTIGRRIYKNLEEVATDLRVKEIIPVEVMEDEDDLVGVIVNPVDYVFGATQGGEVNLFDDFDIDYNKQKYLIETRCSGALTRLKSAIVVRKTAGTDALVTPATPGFDPDAGELTIVDQTGVVYRNADTNAVINAAGSPYAVASGATINVQAEAAAGYYFATSEDDQWSFTAN